MPEEATHATVTRFGKTSHGTAVPASADAAAVDPQLGPKIHHHTSVGSRNLQSELDHHRDGKGRKRTMSELVTV
jgi:hypothetical protein